jgi:hypothetical protein
LNRKIVSLVAAAALGIASPASIAIAQAPAAPKAETQTRAAAGPTVAASKVGISNSTTAPAKPAAAEQRLGAGRNVALMVVGAAALIIGAVIGGTPGVLIAVGGAAVGLYGLYNWVQ